MRNFPSLEGRRGSSALVSCSLSTVMTGTWLLNIQPSCPFCAPRTCIFEASTVMSAPTTLLHMPQGVEQLD